MTVSNIGQQNVKTPTPPPEEHRVNTSKWPAAVRVRM